MQSLRELYRIGMGPSSSHTMGPRRAAEIFRQKHPDAARVRVTLHGSLAATGKGHLTDQAILQGLTPLQAEILWDPEPLPFHPNGMTFEALSAQNAPTATWTVFSIGGGELREPGGNAASAPSIYPMRHMATILAWAQDSGRPLWALVDEVEPDVWDHLAAVWRTMRAAISEGSKAEGVLPGGLKLQRKARSVLARTKSLRGSMRRTALLTAYALAVAEHNAAGGMVATAPTCGSCGVMPAVLTYLHKDMDLDETDILRALATAGLVGNIVKTNASIAGAEVGCQGEVGVACAMAAAAAAQILGGSPAQVEYAAEMGLEHHLGLTCDPILGLVQVPCIERNAFAAIRALSAAEYALLTDGRHLISFDQVVEAMQQTGHDLPSLYRETAQGGLARVFLRPEKAAGLPRSHGD